MLVTRQADDAVAVPVRRCPAVGKAEAAPLLAAGMLTEMHERAAFRFLDRADFLTHAVGFLEAFALQMFSLRLRVNTQIWGGSLVETIGQALHLIALCIDYGVNSSTVAYRQT